MARIPASGDGQEFDSAGFCSIPSSWVLALSYFSNDIEGSFHEGFIEDHARHDRETFLETSLLIVSRLPRESNGRRPGDATQQWKYANTNTDCEGKSSPNQSGESWQTEELRPSFRTTQSLMGRLFSS